MINGSRSVLTEASNCADNVIRGLLPANTAIVAACNLLHNAKDEDDITKINADDLNNVMNELETAIKFVRDAVSDASKSKAGIRVADSIIESDLIVKCYEKEKEFKKQEKQTSDSITPYTGKGRMDLVSDLEMIRNVIYHFCDLNRKAVDDLTKNTNAATMAESVLGDLDRVIENVKNKKYEV